MTQKILKVDKLVFQQPSTKSGVHFANFIPKGIPRLRVRFLVGLRHFVKDYSVPLIITAIVLIILAGLLFARITERATIADLLVGSTNSGQDYGTLLSHDKTNNPTRNTTDASEAGTGITSNPSAQPTNQQNNTSTPVSPTTNTPAPTTTPGGETTPSTPFSAAISYFQQDSVTLQCSSAKPNKGSCSKVYIYSAGIRTQGGPGTVSYGWRSDLASANEDASFTASNGVALTPLQKRITLSCNSAGNYTLQILIASPTQTQSSVANISHNCNDI